MVFSYNDKDPKDFTPTDRLWQALENNNAPAALKIIREEKPDVGDRRMGCTPLLEALRSDMPSGVPDDQSVVQALIDAGADIEQPAGNLFTPLTSALMFDRVEDARRLLKAGADPNGAELGGRTPMHIAIARNQITSVQLLLESGANVRDKGCEGKEPLEYLRSNGVTQRPEILKLLEAADARYEQDLPGILQKAFARGTSQRFLPSKRITLKSQGPGV